MKLSLLLEDRYQIKNSKVSTIGDETYHIVSLMPIVDMDDLASKIEWDKFIKSGFYIVKLFKTKDDADFFKKMIVNGDVDETIKTYYDKFMSKNDQWKIYLDYNVYTLKK